tara:strand:- start:781 stop:1545 length:765 start_codon:yes stop_codon:yes gene_type:complete
MQPFQNAWSLLKALPEQQMGYDDEGMQWNRTMARPIQGLVSRLGGTGQTPSPYDFSAAGGNPKLTIQNLPGHPAEYRYNPKEQGESFRREPHQFPKEGQRVASPEEMKERDSQRMAYLFNFLRGDKEFDSTELLPETYKERNARIFREHQARENAPFVEPNEAAFTALQDIQRAKHALGDFDTSSDLPEAIRSRNEKRRRAHVDAGMDIESMFRAANWLGQDNLGRKEGDEDFQFIPRGREHRSSYFDQTPFME